MILDVEIHKPIEIGDSIWGRMPDRIYTVLDIRSYHKHIHKIPYVSNMLFYIIKVVTNGNADSIRVENYSGVIVAEAFEQATARYDDEISKEQFWHEVAGW